MDVSVVVGLVVVVQFCALAACAGDGGSLVIVGFCWPSVMKSLDISYGFICLDLFGCARWSPVVTPINSQNDNVTMRHQFDDDDDINEFGCLVDNLLELSRIIILYEHLFCCLPGALISLPLLSTDWR